MKRTSEQVGTNIGLALGETDRVASRPPADGAGVETPLRVELALFAQNPFGLGLPRVAFAVR